MGPLPDDEELIRLGLLAGTLGTGARVFHVGFVVEDIDEAAATLGAVLGVPFTKAVDLPPLALATPDGPRDVALRFVYSTRPVHVELIESAPGSLWDWRDDRRGHHLGVWTDDVAREADELDARGLRRVWWATDETGRQVFSYHDTPYGFYIELVDTMAKSFYPEWFAGADPEVLPR